METIIQHHTSHCDGLTLESLELRGQSKPKGIVVILHGMAEHKERYLPFMEECVKHEFIGFIYDHRGHGNSVKTTDDLGYFYDKTAKYIVTDVTQMIAYIKTKYPNVPVYLLAHSMGTLVARVFLQEHDDIVDKVILCGAPYNNPLAGLGLMVTSLLSKLFGEHHRSRLMHALAFGSFDRKFTEQTLNCWLTKNQANVKAYNENPKTGYIFTLNGFYNLLTLSRLAFNKENWHVKQENLPIYFIAGEDDPVIGSLQKWQDTQNFIKNRGYRHVTSKSYPGLRHEILLEQEAEQVVADIMAFIS